MVNIIFVHGVAKSDPNYAKSMIDLIGPVPGVNFVSTYWGDINKIAEEEIISDETKATLFHKTGLKQFREPIDEFVGDAASWFNPACRAKIQQRIASQLANLPEGDNIWFLHSFGNVVILDSTLRADLYPEAVPIKAAFEKNNKGLFTAGCPLFLMQMATPDCYKQITTPWTNFFHALDLVGSPIDSVSSAIDVEVTDTDVPSDVRSYPALLFAQAAHHSYWNSKMVAKAIRDLASS